MARRVRLNASVGRQRITKLTPGNQKAYIGSIRDAMNSIVKNYESIINGLEGANAEILFDALKPTFELSQKYCPVDSGALKDSGFLEVEQSGRQSRVVIGYAKGGKPDYAAFVHEITTYYHKAPTRAKFLLTALEQDAANIQARIVQGYKNVIGT